MGRKINLVFPDGMGREKTRMGIAWKKPDLQKGEWVTYRIEVGDVPTYLTEVINPDGKNVINMNELTEFQLDHAKLARHFL